MDRFDLFIQLEREPVKLQGASNQKSSREYQAGIIKARGLQLARFKGKSPALNSLIKASNLKEYCQMDPQTEAVVLEHANKAKISMRSFHHILKIARTIADLNQHENILKPDVLESFTYRLQPTSPLI
jgi:magnesium chelatase family protein